MERSFESSFYSFAEWIGSSSDWTANIGMARRARGVRRDMGCRELVELSVARGVSALSTTFRGDHERLYGTTPRTNARYTKPGIEESGVNLPR